MRDLVRISEEDLQELTAPQRLRVLVAIGIAGVCTVVSLQGVLALFIDASVVSLPGMNQLAGQIAWTTSLVLMLIAATFLVRGVVKRRLQWAVALSLLIHFLLCVSMSAVNLSGSFPAPAQAADLPGRPPEELTLSEYAGMEIPNPESAWQQPTETDTPETRVELERPETEIAETDKPEPVDATQPQDIEQLDTPERQEHIKIADETRADMQRKASDSELSMLEQADAPKVSTAESAAPEIEAQVEQARQSSETLTADREPMEITSDNPVVEAASLAAQRTEAAPEAPAVQASTIQRAVTELQAASTPQEVALVATLAAQQMKVLQQAIAVARQQSAAAHGSTSDPLNSATPRGAGQPGVSSSVRPDRATSSSDATGSIPASGGSLSIARSSSRTSNAVNSDADSVLVRSASGVEAPVMAESSGVMAGKRASVGSVAIGSATSAGSTVPDAIHSTGPVGSVSVVRSAAGGSSPQLGEPGAQSITAGQREGRQMSAVGTSVDEVGVARVGSSDATSGDALVDSPDSLSPGRRGNALPSGANFSGSISGPSSQGSSLAGSAGPSRLANNTVRASRGTEPSARLNANAGFGSGTSPGVSMARTTMAASVPTGAVEAEQGGALVFAGPQAASTGPAGLSGTGKNSLPRRSAGLPGSSISTGSVAPASLGAAEPARVAAGSPRAGAGNDRPALAAASSLAGLIRKSGIAGLPQASIADSLSLRTTDARREAARTLGGSEASEEAVERGLAWLARNQYPDGHWSIHDFPGDDVPDAGHGSFQSDSAATGLALLAFLGAGYTHQSGNYQETVNRGMTWLLDHQKPNGDLFADETEFVWFYSHGIAAIAVCEAYGMTKDIQLREPAQRALDFIIESQHPEFGGWRYRPQFESDTSVSGWQLMALKSGEMSGLKVPKESYAGVAKWLDTVQSSTAAGHFSYHPSREASIAMTAEGLLMRQYLGAKRDDAELIAGASFLRTRPPDFGQRDAYYWYYATQVMFHMQGEYWSEWNNSLRDTLVNTQSKEGASGGSWDPARPTPEKWSTAGGRHYLTCLNLLMLEVYYRHLPLYLELEK